ncbi:MAG: hypothetical protein GF313_05165, partial [Caldithrix sp.]|nr:hypothetical protein [Caldithrix sp.]
MRYILALLCPFCIVNSSFSNIPLNPKFEHLTVTDGLSSMNVISIYQDYLGFLWIGTEIGLNKYDGYDIQNYVRKVGDKFSLSHNTITAITEDADSILWIGTGYNGINKFNRDSEDFLSIYPEGLYTSDLCRDFNKNLWIGTEREGGGLYKLTKRLKNADSIIYSFKCFKQIDGNSKSLNHSSVTCIIEDSNQNLWIGTYNGLCRRDNNDTTFTRYLFVDSLNKAKQPIKVTCLFEDDQEDIWMGTENSGLYKYTHKTNHFEKVLEEISGPVASIEQDNRGNIWIGLNNEGGLYIYDDDSDYLKHLKKNNANIAGLNDNTINIIYKDRSGIMWIGTKSGGINKFDWKKQVFNHLNMIRGETPSLNDNIVQTIFEENENLIWIGTSRGGVNLLDLSNQSVSYLQVYESKTKISDIQNVKCIFIDKYKNVWFGTEVGLAIFDRKINKIIHYKNILRNKEKQHLICYPIRALLRDKNDLIWIGTEGHGLIRFNPETETFSQFSRNNKKWSGGIWVHFIHEDNKNNLWIGSEGLNLYDRKNDSFSLFNTLYAVHFMKDIQDRIWYSRFVGGIMQVSTDGKHLQHITESDGLASNDAWCIFQDESTNIWISTGKGITRINTEDNSIVNFDVRDGLQSNEFLRGAGHQGKSGRLYFGGTNGLNFFYPDSIK